MLLIIYVLQRQGLTPRGRAMIAGFAARFFLPQGCTINILIIYVL